MHGVQHDDSMNSRFSVVVRLIAYEQSDDGSGLRGLHSLSSPILGLVFPAKELGLQSFKVGIAEFLSL